MVESPTVFIGTEFGFVSSLAFFFILYLLNVLTFCDGEQTKCSLQDCIVPLYAIDNWGYTLHSLPLATEISSLIQGPTVFTPFAPS